MTPTAQASIEVASYKYAFEHLNADGLIYEDRAGIAEFSGSQRYVETALIACPRCLKAATVIDGFDYRYHRSAFRTMASPMLATQRLLVCGHPCTINISLDKQVVEKGPSS